MPITVNLLPWEPRVSGGYARVELTVEGEKAAVSRHVGTGAVRPSGWFAVYEGAVFGVFEWCGTKNCHVALLVDDKIWPLKAVQLSSTRTLTHRSFCLKGASGSFVFNYQRLWWNLLHKPRAALLDIVFADDWWGVVCDLPGWVESRWNAGHISEELAWSIQEHSSGTPEI